MRTLLLSVHIISVAAWLGGNFAQMFLMRGFTVTDSGLAAAWSFGSGFVTIGFIAVIIGAVTGITFFGPRAERAVQEFEGGLVEAGRKTAWSFGVVAMADTAIVLIAVVAMVGHWQA